MKIQQIQNFHKKGIRSVISRINNLITDIVEAQTTESFDILKSAAQNYKDAYENFANKWKAYANNKEVKNQQKLLQQLNIKSNIKSLRDVKELQFDTGSLAFNILNIAVGSITSSRQLKQINNDLIKLRGQAIVFETAIQKFLGKPEINVIISYLSTTNQIQYARLSPSDILKQMTIVSHGDKKRETGTITEEFKTSIRSQNFISNHQLNLSEPLDEENDPPFLKSLLRFIPRGQDFTLFQEAVEQLWKRVKWITIPHKDWKEFGIFGKDYYQRANNRGDIEEAIGQVFFNYLSSYKDKITGGTEAEKIEQLISEISTALLNVDTKVAAGGGDIEIKQENTILAQIQMKNPHAKLGGQVNLYKIARRILEFKGEKLNEELEEQLNSGVSKRGEKLDKQGNNISPYRQQLLDKVNEDIKNKINQYVP